MNKKELEMYEAKIDLENSRRGVCDLIINDNKKSNNIMSSSYFTELNQAIDGMYKIRINVAYRPLISTHRIIGKSIVLFKKIVRKVFLKWYVEPICFQQTDFNEFTTRATKAMQEVIKLILEQQESMVEQQKSMLEQQEKVLAWMNEETGKVALLEKIELENDRKLLGIEEKFVLLQNKGVDFSKTNDFYRYTAAQAGEDAIIRYILDGFGIANHERTYVDLGANHAIELSNTYCLYQQGATGVLVEANPVLLPELQLYRNKDIILPYCVSSESNKWVDFHTFKEDGLSTACKESVEECLKENENLHLDKVYKIKTISVEDIIELYLKKTPVVLNVDVEGLEVEILNSIDFNKYRPVVIIIETIPYKKKLVIGDKRNDIVEFMSSVSYVEYAFTGINSIFIDLKSASKFLDKGGAL